MESEYIETNPETIEVEDIKQKQPKAQSAISISNKWKKVPMYQVLAKDAKQFGTNQQNRKVDAKHVAKIKKGYIESIEYLPPITVNSTTGNVIDGQHRLQAFLELIEEGNLPKDATILVRFIEADEKDERKLIIDANTKTKNWNQNDFVNSYTSVNANYSKLTEWCLSHRLCHNEGKPIYRYASAIIKGKSSGTKLKKGEFEITEEELNKAENNYNEVSSIIDKASLSTTGAYIESLAISWLTNKNWLLKGFGNFDNILAFLEKKKQSLIWGKKYSGKKDWDGIFSALYNSASGKFIGYDKALEKEEYPIKFLILNDDRTEISGEEQVTDENIIIPNIEEVISTTEN